MDIAPVGHRTSRSERRTLVLGLLILVPVVLLVLLPAVLGLDRYVVTDRAMDGSLARGSVVLAQEVPPSRLEAGDVVTFKEPGDGGRRLVRRIASIDDGVATLRSDETGAADPVDDVTLPLTEETYDRVWLGVPWIGYPFAEGGGWLLLLAVAGAALGTGLAAGRRTSDEAAPPVRESHLVG